ncbi:helix-turn-helix domain-containing protein [Deinococcus sp.]
MGRKQLFVVRLSEEERQKLTELTRKGVISARVMTRARLLLLSDQGLKDREVADRQGVDSATVAYTRRKYVEGGLQAALVEKARPKQAPKLNPQQTAILIAETCSNAPEGRASWSM